MTTIDLLAAAVEATIDGFSATIHTPIHLVAFAIEPFRQAVPAGSIGSIRLAIEIAIDAIAAAIVAFFDAITLAIEAILDAIAGVGERCAAAEQQPGYHNDSLPDVHNPLRGCLCSVLTTRSLGIG